MARRILMALALATAAVAAATADATWYRLLWTDVGSSDYRLHVRQWLTPWPTVLAGTPIPTCGAVAVNCARDIGTMVEAALDIPGAPGAGYDVAVSAGAGERSNSKPLQQPTLTATVSATATRTRTPTRTRTNTPVPSPTQSAAPTMTATQTIQPTETPSAVSTPTVALCTKVHVSGDAVFRPGVGGTMPLDVEVSEVPCP